MSDAIRIDELLLTLSVADVDAQAVLLSLSIPHDVSRAAREDDLAHSIDYAGVYATLVDALPQTHHPSLEALVACVFETLARTNPEVEEASVVVALRGAAPRLALETTRTTASPSPWRFVVGGLELQVIVGVNPGERTEKQPVVLDVTVDRERHGPKEIFPFAGLSASIHQTFAASSYLTVEALASAVACHVLEYTKKADDKVTIKLSKPNALALAASAQVQITRQRTDFADVFSPRASAIPTSTISQSSSLHSVALALGSNLGDRFANIETALRLLEVPRSLLSDLPGDAHLSVVDTSFMYETAPMYVTDQPRFANCACIVETNLAPRELLRLVKQIETMVGRVPSVRFGPRAVDVDIITYGDKRIDTRPPDKRASSDNLIGELVVPHPRLCEREFVLRPLNDMIPHFIHPGCNKTLRLLLDELVSAQTVNDYPMFKVIPFPKYPLEEVEPTKIASIQVPPTAKFWTLSSTDGRPRKTHLMATLNVTPDSFSDGSQHDTLPAALAYSTSAVAAGADIVDVGGYSTRPHADPVSPADELARVLPVIRAIRASPTDALRRALISIDTFRRDVAVHAVRAGANCINDVHAFTGPGYPLDGASTERLVAFRGAARTLGVPVVLMHSRGDAGENKGYTGHEGLVEAVRAELGRKVDAIVRGPGGVRRWLVLVDPGIGFSKPVEGQLALMRDLGRVTACDEDEGKGGGRGGNPLAGFPLLVGPSKKSVWGSVLERADVDGAYEGRKTTAQERGWATAAAIACAVQQGANVVRVHDVAEMRDVVAVASAIWNPMTGRSGLP